MIDNTTRPLRRTLAVLFSLFALVFGTFGEAQAQQDLATRPLPGTNVRVLDSLARQWRIEDSVSKAQAWEKAAQLGWPTKGETFELMRLDETGFPVYNALNNRTAARTIGTVRLREGGGLGLDLTGQGMTIGMWEGGSPRTTHQEFGDRIRLSDNSRYTDCNTVNYHATHVAGTLIASGVDNEAQGMAYEARVDAYDWNNAEAEMAAAAERNMLISNHSYGDIAGWHFNTNNNRWEWYGNPLVNPREDFKFGFYDNGAQRWDQIALAAPYYLIVKSAGNNRDSRQPSGSYWVYNAQSNRWEESTAQRNADGPWDCIATEGVAKNVLTVGAVNDLTGGYAGPSSVRLTSFSSTGPADDGRIKPDLVANGDRLKSAGCRNDTRYETESGTSMSSPSLAGSLLLIQQLNAQMNEGQYLKSSTLKGLAIHTADEAGNAPGPDYEYGWGLANIGRAAEFVMNNGTDRHIREETIFSGVPYVLRMQAIGNNEPLKVTICWNDPAGRPGAAAVDDRTPKLVNDLDMRVTKGEEEHMPWILDPERPTAPATLGDNVRDNIEQIIIEEAEGEYILTINNKGELSGRSQEFALIISGASLFAGSCAQFTRITNSEGSLTDGSPVEAPFVGGSRCCWLLEPADASRLRLHFSRLDLNSTGADSIVIYDGATTSAEVLAVLRSDEFTDTLRTSSAAALVCFYAAEGNAEQATGWTLNYAPQPFCEQRTTLTTQAGTITDGSGASDYNNNTRCEWLIQPENAAAVRFWMAQIAVENNRDFARVYDGPTTASPLLRAFTGTRLTNSDTLVSSGPVMLVVFETDEVGRGAGFQARYNTIPVGRGLSLPAYEGLDLWPNPTTVTTTLRLKTTASETVNLRIIDVTGRKVQERAIRLSAGEQSHEIDVESLQSGLYFVEVEGSRMGRMKLIVQ